ncbi:MAG: hypothetical protein R3324_07975 [Halobacteriales archaeon]|nr:hypothetical protein [Halobacteriales archaeon]
MTEEQGSPGNPGDDERVRCWLVERTYDDKGLVRIVYATADGTRAVTTERSAALLNRQPATAAKMVPVDSLTAVTTADTRKRYATEARRMRERHDPSDEV